MRRYFAKSSQNTLMNLMVTTNMQSQTLIQKALDADKRQKSELLQEVSKYITIEQCTKNYPNG